MIDGPKALLITSFGMHQPAGNVVRWYLEIQMHEQCGQGPPHQAPRRAQIKIREVLQPVSTAASCCAVQEVRKKH